MADVPTQQLEAIVDLVRDVFGATASGVYLHGSAVAGGLQPHSDLDLLVVTDRRTTHGEKARLSVGLLDLSDGDDRPGFERPVELTIVALPDVRPWRYPPRVDYQYGEWIRDRFECGDLEPERQPNPDLAIVLTAALQHSRPLAGSPPAAALLEPIPTGDLRRAMTDELDVLVADLDTDTRNILLTLARIWATLETGEIHAKDAAADWVLGRLPAEHRPVIVRARAIYLGEEPERWDDLRERVHPASDELLRAIRAA